MLFVIFVSVIAFLSYYFYYQQLKRYIYIWSKVSELPGKKGIFILGNILEFLGSSEYVFRKITLFFSEYSRNGIVCLRMGPLPYILVADPDALERILRTPINNSKGIVYNIVRPWLNEGLLTSTGDKWHTRRKLLTTGFHFNILQKFLPIFVKESKSFVDGLREHIHHETDVKGAVGSFTLDTICETAMGTTLKEHHGEGEKYRSSVNEFGLIVVERSVKTWLLFEPIYRFTTTYLKQVKILKVLHGFTKQVIDARKKNFPESKEMEDGEEFSSSNRNKAMLDLLIAAQREENKISDEGIQEEVDTFVFEGHDTTSVSLSFSLMLLANNKQYQEKAYQEAKSIFGEDTRDPTNSDLQEMRYLECCIKESLRLYPSVPKISRELGEDINLDNGLIIPKNSCIVVLIYEMHRRADLYPDPEKFDPDRFLPENTVHRHPYAYIPFSAGPRNCIGQKFAMMEMKCLLSTILRNYSLEPVDTPETMECILDLVLRTKNPIRVKFVPRNN